MKLSELKRQTAELLSFTDDPEFEAAQIIRRFCSFGDYEYRFEPDKQIEQNAVDDVLDAVNQRRGGRPLQYVIGEWDFMSHSFFVDERVLIPRPETEQIAQRAIEFIGSRKLNVVDACCGSGCIGLSTAAACKNAFVSLFDFSENALSVTLQNAERLGVKNVNVFKHDLFDGPPEILGNTDVFLCNPPYIPTSELDTLQAEVRREPASALDGGGDGLKFYRAIASDWLPFLNDGAFFMLEAGEDQPAVISEMIDKNIFTVKIEEDFLGVPRFVTGVKKYTER